jgi:hypothetical protein
MGYIVIGFIISIYLLAFHPLERFLLFVSLFWVGKVIVDTLNGYKRVKPVHKAAFRRVMVKHFLLCFTIGAVPLVFIVAYLVSFILQQDPRHPVIGYMGAAVAVVFLYSYGYFIAPRTPPQKPLVFSDKEKELIEKWMCGDPANQVQVQETPDGKYLVIRPERKKLSFTPKVLIICVLVLIAVDILIYFFPQQAGLLILSNFFLAGYMMKKMLAPFKKDKKKTPVMPVVVKIFIATLPLSLGLGIEIFRQGLSLLASGLIALCIQLAVGVITYFVEPYPNSVSSSR